MKFVGAAGHANLRIGVWLWTETILENDAQPIEAVRCSEPALPQYRERIERRGLCLLRPGAIKANV